MKKAFVNGKILVGESLIENKILVFDEKIIGLYDQYDLDLVKVIDLKGQFISAGFIDIHIHGLKGHDVMDATQIALKEISQSLPMTGVTSFLATTMTLSEQKIEKTFEAISDYRKSQNQLEARLQGIHVEGPFINKVYKGAQNESFIVPPNEKILKNYYNDIRLITFAPEVKGALALFDVVKSQAPHIKFSIGHSAATYEEAVLAYETGVESTTHLFNAMTGLHHRKPGIVGAVFKKKPYFEIIADQIHLHTAIYDILGDSIGKEKMILITDAMCACHMPPGTYSLGGQVVLVDENSARLENGSLAGSILKMNHAIKNVYDNTPYSLAEVVRMATENPATMLDLNDVGTIKEGYKSDFTVFDNDINIISTWINGQVVYGLEN